MTGQEAPVLPITIQVALDLWSSGRLALDRDTRTVEAAVGGLLRHLGIEATPRVRFEAAADAVRVLVHDTAIGYPRELLDRLYRANFGHGAGALPDDARPLPALWRRVFHEDAADPDAGRQRLAKFLADAVVEILKLAPGRLLGPVASGVLSAILPSDAERSANVARSLLDHAIPLHERDLIRAAVADGIVRGESDADIAEQVIARLQSRTLDVELHPRYGASLLGILDTSEPVPAEAFSSESEPGKLFTLMRNGLFSELGIRLPPLRIACSADVPEGCFRLRVGAISHAPWPGLGPDQILVNASAPFLRSRFDMESVGALHPADEGSPTAIIEAHEHTRVQEAGLMTWTPLGYLILAVASDVRRCAGLFVHLDAVEADLARLDAAFPALTRAVLQRWSLEEITRVARMLVSSGISIQNPRTILERLVSYDYIRVDRRAMAFDERLWIDTALSPVLASSRTDRVVEYVRCGFRASLARAHSDSAGILNVYLLDPDEIEQPLAEELAFQQRVSGRPTRAGQALQRIRAFLAAESSEVGRRRIILTHNQVANFLRRELRTEFRDVVVLAYQELSPKCSIRPLQRIGRD